MSSSFCNIWYPLLGKGRLHFAFTVGFLVIFASTLTACDGNGSQSGGQSASTPTTVATSLPTATEMPTSTPMLVPTTSTGTGPVPYPTTVEQAAQVLGVDKGTLSKIGTNGWHIEAGADVLIHLPGLVCVDFPVYPQDEIKARLKADTEWIDVKSMSRAHLRATGGTLLTNSATVYWGYCPHLS